MGSPKNWNEGGIEDGKIGMRVENLEIGCQNWIEGGKLDWGRKIWIECGKFGMSGIWNMKCLEWVGLETGNIWNEENLERVVLSVHQFLLAVILGLTYLLTFTENRQKRYVSFVL